MVTILGMFVAVVIGCGMLASVLMLPFVGAPVFGLSRFPRAGLTLKGRPSRVNFARLAAVLWALFVPFELVFQAMTGSARGVIGWDLPFVAPFIVVFSAAALDRAIWRRPAAVRPSGVAGEKQ